jgi:hypothetical protein
MAPFNELIGGSYRGVSSQSDDEQTINFYVETVGSPTGRTKSSRILLSAPGKKLWLATGGAYVQAEAELNGRAFAIASGVLYEVFADQTQVSRGTVGPAAIYRTEITPSESQLLITCAGNGWCFDLAADTLTFITQFPAGGQCPCFIDGYFVVQQPDSQNFSISGLNDGLTWNPLDFGNAPGQAGDLVGMIAEQRQLWLLFNTHSEVYVDSGDPNFPFTRLESAFCDQGLAGQSLVANADNTIFWVSQNREGGRMAWRASGYTPSRISDHGVETAMASYPTISNGVCYTYQENGHTFWSVHFPSAHNGRGATWVYDVSSGLWAERRRWNARQGAWYADRARTHMYAFGKHLVGDWQTGNIYEQSMQYATDAGDVIRRIRITPGLVNQGGRYVFYSELRLLTEVGVGLTSPAPATQSILLTEDVG